MTKEKILNYSEFNNEKTALMITAFNRPHYLEKVIESLNTCEELSDIPIYIFLDNGFHSKIKDNIKVFSKLKFLNKFIKIREHNYGCERNILGAMYQLFEQENFKNLLIIEDDLVVSKNYFKYIFNNYKKIKLEKKDCATFQGWTECLLDKENKKKYLNDIQINTGENLWGYIIDSETWFSIKDIIDGYIEFFKNAPNDGTVKIYRDSVLMNPIKKYYIDCVKKYNCNDEKILNRYHSNTFFNVSQDEIIALSISLKGLNRYYPKVNRSLYIGEVGLHSNVGDFKRLGFDKINLDEDILYDK